MCDRCKCNRVMKSHKRNCERRPLHSSVNRQSKDWQCCHTAVISLSNVSANSHISDNGRASSITLSETWQALWNHDECILRDNASKQRYVNVSAFFWSRQKYLKKKSDEWQKKLYRYSSVLLREWNEMKIKVWSPDHPRPSSFHLSNILVLGR